jgi:hypothetical protein
MDTLKAELRERLAGASDAEEIEAVPPLTGGLKDILAETFRCNPDYELIESARLSPAQQELLGLHTDEDCFGVLNPMENSDLGLKSVGKDIALLFYALGNPGRLPAFVTRAADEEVNALIAELVLEDILQIAGGRGFSSGAAAQDLLYQPRDPEEDLGLVSRISLDALRFGQRLPISDAVALSVQLYFYNRLPVTPMWQRRLGEEAALAEFVGADRAQWRQLDPTPATRGWRRFSLRDSESEAPPDADGYQLYVSPALEAIPDVLPAMADVFAETRVRLFKVGADLANLCRADKIVADVDGFEQLQRVGRALDERLGDVPAQGVPFTAELRRDGLLSWGVEPHRPPAGAGREYEYVGWRRWVTYRLAGALLEAREVPGVEPWRLALQRARLDGIDSETWTPLPGRRRRVGND